VLINIDGYWNDFIAYLETLPDFDPRYLITVDTLAEIMPALLSWQAPEIVQIDHLHYPHFEDEIGRKTNQPIIVDIASIENSYFALSAIGLKQLAKHNRKIGLLNTNGQFDKLQTWIETAAKERFITENCKKLFTIDDNEEHLRERLKATQNITIDLHNDKWGESISH
jgi:hypothetical protein